MARQQQQKKQEGEVQKETTGLGMTVHHLPLKDDDEPRQQPSPPRAVVDQLFERLTALSSQFESAVEFSSSLQAKHAVAQSMISAVESKVTSLETLVRTSQTQQQVRSSSPVIVPAAIDPNRPESDTPAASSPPRLLPPAPRNRTHSRRC